MKSFRATLARHPGLNWVCGAVEFVIAGVLLILGIAPALAFSIPVTDKLTLNINLGELPQWIVALVAAGGFIQAWRAKSAASRSEAAAKRSEATSTSNAATLKNVSTQIDGLLAERDKGNVAKGEAKGVAAGEAKAEQLAEGIAQGIELGRDMAPHPVSGAPAAAAPPSLVAGVAPVPVTDEAAQRVAKATETLAAVAKQTMEKST